jgi:predicted nucleotidyltransferase
MDLEYILSTAERIRILEHILFKTDPFNVTKVASELGLSKGLVSKFLSILVGQKVLVRARLRYQIRPGPNVKALRIMFNIKKMDPQMFKKYRTVQSVGAYGSKVKGSDVEGSDLDLYIIVDRSDDLEQSRLSRDLRQRYGNVKPLYLTKEKVRQLKRDNEMFYYSLAFGSITVYGDGIEAVSV